MEGPMSQQFELSGDNITKRHHVICRRDRFYDDVPEAVRKRGPWQLVKSGEVMALLPEYRRTLARDGYVYVEAHPVGLKVTV